MNEKCVGNLHLAWTCMIYIKNFGSLCLLQKASAWQWILYWKRAIRYIMINDKQIYENSRIITKMPVVLSKTVSLSVFKE